MTTKQVNGVTIAEADVVIASGKVHITAELIGGVTVKQDKIMQVVDSMVVHGQKRLNTLIGNEMKKSQARYARVKKQREDALEKAKKALADAEAEVNKLYAEMEIGNDS